MPRWGSGEAWGGQGGGVREAREVVSIPCPPQLEFVFCLMLQWRAAPTGSDQQPCAPVSLAGVCVTVALLSPAVLVNALEDDDCGVVGAALAAWKELLGGLGVAPLAQWATQVMCFGWRGVF